MQCRFSLLSACSVEYPPSIRGLGLPALRSGLFAARHLLDCSATLDTVRLQGFCLADNDTSDEKQFAITKIHVYHSSRNTFSQKFDIVEIL